MKTDEEIMKDGIAALRTLLRSMRSDEQGGYTDVKGGKFVGTANFVSRNLPHATPEQLDALFALAGVVPDSIEVNGSCEKCVHGDAVRGGDMGWGRPCAGCSRPKMTKFVSLSAVEDSALRITDDDARFLTNMKNDIWWATGIVTAKRFTKKWNSEIDACYVLREKLKKREMVSGIDYRLSQKGLRALKLHESNGKKNKRRVA